MLEFITDKINEIAKLAAKKVSQFYDIASNDSLHKEADIDNKELPALRDESLPLAPDDIYIGSGGYPFFFDRKYKKLYCGGKEEVHDDLIKRIAEENSINIARAIKYWQSSDKLTRFISGRVANTENIVAFWRTANDANIENDIATCIFDLIFVGLLNKNGKVHFAFNTGEGVIPVKKYLGIHDKLSFKVQPVTPKVGDRVKIIADPMTADAQHFIGTVGYVDTIYPSELSYGPIGEVVEERGGLLIHVPLQHGGEEHVDVPAENWYDFLEIVPEDRLSFKVKPFGPTYIIGKFTTSLSEIAEVHTSGSTEIEDLSRIIQDVFVVPSIEIISYSSKEVRAHIALRVNDPLLIYRGIIFYGSDADISKLSSRFKRGEIEPFDNAYKNGSINMLSFKTHPIDSADEIDPSRKRKIKGAVTPLERYVQKWINNYAPGYGDSVEDVIKDIVQQGCESGFVSELIYYADTVKFYKKYKLEIMALLRGILSDIGTGPEGLFGDKWDEEDMFAEEDMNQNLLAWFGFEETTRILGERNGLNI